DMLKGKQGRFRQNLLGKRVDYSGRSVIVVGPELGFNECGLPKKMALELFDPFIIRELEKRGFASTIKSAKKMIEREEAVVYDILEDIIKDHPVMLNRAPTLHRLGIQAFMPRLVEGKAIRLHPLSCAAFNADFDGDQMAVHVPLSIEARLEAKMLMLAENNILKPADGRPVATPSQDIILGCFYLTKLRHDQPGEYIELRKGPDGKIHELNRPSIIELRHKLGHEDFEKQYSHVGTRGVYSSPAEAVMAHHHNRLHLQAEIKVRIQNYRKEGGSKYFFTSVGRLIFADILPKDKVDYMDLANEVMTKKSLGQVISVVFEACGSKICAKVLDDIKNLGFRYAKLGGISICMKDMVIPESKQRILDEARVKLAKINRDFSVGNLTDEERYQSVISLWTQATDVLTKDLMEALKVDQAGLNPVYIMSFSGARGNRDQIRQLAGMRGLMQRPTKKLTGAIGEIIESPILSNFREGLTVLEYFISTHGARKGLADTALKTADAGYLTRRLCDVAQDLIVTEVDCGTHNGILVRPVTDVDSRGERVIVPLRDRITGRTSVHDIEHPATGEVIVARGSEITEEVAREIEDAGIDELEVRTLLTCQTRRGVCRNCYGRNMATGKMVDLGEAVGIIAAQSIGEPGTQLTLRTFHTGGVSQGVVEGWYESEVDGTVKFKGLKHIETTDGELIVTNRLGTIKVLDKDGNEVQNLPNIPYGARLRKRDGDLVAKKEEIVRWDPSSSPIIAEADGVIAFEDIIEGITMRTEFDPEKEASISTITEYKEERHPKLRLQTEDGDEIANYQLSSGTVLTREAIDGKSVARGQVLARVPRPRTKSRDITGGLPRVDELFEARKPKEIAYIADVSGTFEIRGIAKGMRKCAIVPEKGEEHTYSIPLNRNFLVRDKDRVNVGDPLTDGSLSPHDILRVKGEKAVMQFLMTEIQEVYRLQGVTISDKHIEAIVRQMLKKIIIEQPGDTRFLFGQQVDKWLFTEENERVIRDGGLPAVGKPKLLGLTKASLETESFISAASFQETTRVLTDAAIRGRKDHLRGLKENVIMGLLIPAGTGLSRYRSLTVNSEAEARRAAEELADAEASAEPEAAR
ncbi:MAG: DNA-directed RNA polymerase subunit beta', partial [Candidatus Sumerlaeia bacterium]|nr:DNA-directed RNA polymerase subunit beta' [Candidatus Sumerlaeia bacterium]